MVRKEMKLIGLEKLVHLEAYQELKDSKAENREFNDKELATMVEDDDDVEDDYKDFLLSILSEEPRTKSLNKRREKADDDDDDSDCYTDNDRQYGLFLQCLSVYEKSYAVKDERNGLPIFIKYEEDENECLDKGCDLGYRRKLRSATKQSNGPSDECKHEPQSTSSKETENLSLRKRKLRSATKQSNGSSGGCKHEPQYTSSKETENSSRRKLSSRAKSGNAETVKVSTDEIVLDPDYCTFLKKLKVLGDHYVYEYGAHTVVYEANSGGIDREGPDNDWAADVEFLDSETFYKEGSLNPYVAAAADGLENMHEDRFRQQLIAVLRKPYDREELDKLRRDIKNRAPEMRHIELRHGRDRSCSTDKKGKSYLDHHPDLKRRFKQLRHDKPKRLNLLRGFYFWLEKSAHEGSFQPWKDEECLDIKPESG